MKSRILITALLFLTGSNQFVQASTPCLYDLTRIGKYHSVQRANLNYDSRFIFMDPIDTETVASVGLSLIKPGDRVLDLGSGSGIPTQAYVRQGGAAYAVGLDVSTESVHHANNKFGSSNLLFALSDYTQSSPQQIVEQFFQSKAPDVVISNPPYVPSIGIGEGIYRTMNGGPDGLKFIRRVMDIGAAMKAKLGFITGSYSSPIQAFDILVSKGYRIKSLTFSVIAFGNFSEANRDQILILESQNRAFLLRNIFPGKLAYIAIGITAEPIKPGESPLITSAEFNEMLIKATKSKTTELEMLPVQNPLPVRVLNLSNIE